MATDRPLRPEEHVRLWLTSHRSDYYGTCTTDYCKVQPHIDDAIAKLARHALTRQVSEFLSPDLHWDEIDAIAKSWLLGEVETLELSASDCDPYTGTTYGDLM